MDVDEAPTPTGSNVYRINYDTIHTTPSGSYPSFGLLFSINMVSLRDMGIQTKIKKSNKLAA